MRTAGTGVLSTLGGSFKLQTWVDVWYNGNQIIDNMPVSEGSINYDITQDVQAQLQFKAADATGELVALLPTDPLACYGQEVNVSMGVSSGAQVAEPLSIGWFRIQDQEAEQKWIKTPSGQWRSGGSSIEVVACDRMQVIADAQMLVVSQPPTGATIFAEIARLVRGLVPMGTINVNLTNAQVPASIVYDKDRLKTLKALASALGGVLSINANGLLDVDVATPYGATPIWTFTIGDQGTISSYKMKMTRDGVYNAVMASGQATTDLAPVSAVAYDNDLASPTRWAGPFGQVPLFFDSPLLTTHAMAATAATTRLNNDARGRDREYTFSVVPNHLIELDDPVRVNLPDRVITGKITKMNLPLTPGAMTLTVRALDSSVVVLGN